MDIAPAKSDHDEPGRANDKEPAALKSSLPQNDDYEEPEDITTEPTPTPSEPKIDINKLKNEILTDGMQVI